MADNTTLNTMSGGDVIASDDITTLNGGAVSGVKAQRVKVGFGSDASFRDVDSSNGLPTSDANVYTRLNDGSQNTAITSALPAGTNNIGSVNAAAASTGGATTYKLISAATTNATSVKASAGTVYNVTASNINAAVRYLKLYNKASAPTVGTDTPVQVYAIPGATTGAGTNIPVGLPGLDFPTGIAFAITTGAADSDTSAVAANEIIVNLGYK